VWWAGEAEIGVVLAGAAVVGVGEGVGGDGVAVLAVFPGG
jgi:hypothetical protein